MSSKIGHLKPFMIEEKKEGPNKTISETTFNKWQGCITANVKKEEKWKDLLIKEWQPKKVTNRGLEQNVSLQVDLMLEYVSQYAPNALYRDITLRSTSLKSVWTLVRNWAGLKSSGCKQHVYYTTKHSFDPNGELTPTDFYFSLRNAKEDCLLLCPASGGKVTFQGSLPTSDEELSPTLESDVVLDWLDILGGAKLVEHIFRVFSKELETESLSDLRQRISENLVNLRSEADQQAELNRALVSHPPNQPRQFGRRSSAPQQRSFQPRQSQPPRNFFQNKPRPQNPQPPCKLCLTNNPRFANSHSIGSCYQLNQSEQRQLTRTVLTEDYVEDNQDTGDTYQDHQDDEEYTEDNYLSEEVSATKALRAYQPNQDIQTSVIKIGRVNIHESPILACSYNSNTIYLILDTGATASIMTKRMADTLNLQVLKTGHKAVQVDGETKLPVLGEVHTTFTRGSISLNFSGLVVASLGVDILAGTNFHIENDVYSRMSKGTIHIGDNCTFQSSPPALLQLDNMSTSKLSKQRLVQVPITTTILPGDSCKFNAPPDIKPDDYVMIEPNLQQTTSFFSPTITQLQTGSFSVCNESDDPVVLKKNCQAFSLYTTSDSQTSITNPLEIPPIQKLSNQDIQKDIKIDGNLTHSESKSIKDVVAQHNAVFQPTLPGYNNAFGPVFASFTFASNHRPKSQKLRSPNYSSHQNLLFNLKCLQLRQQGVLLDPIQHNIQPIMSHNAWVVKKSSSATTPWEKCSVKDVRLVVGLDPLNKFLRDPPGKVTKTESIYAALANWQFMGEIDFSDFYFQIKFKTNSEQDKERLGYLCIRGDTGTHCFSRATMGLLGMDVFQDELTDRVFGDLVVGGHVVKIADNVYFGGNTFSEFLTIFQTIIQRCDTADLRLKPSKVRLNIQSADILGLHWHQGTLTTSKHKLDPLAACPPPKTVRGLRSWLGAVRFNEICLPGTKLASLTKILDEQIPAKRSGKEEIDWTADLLHNFQQVQHVLQQPLSVAIP